jgi:hypothetical protein
MSIDAPRFPYSYLQGTSLRTLQPSRFRSPYFLSDARRVNQA